MTFATFHLSFKNCTKLNITQVEHNSRAWHLLKLKLVLMVEVVLAQQSKYIKKH